MKKFVMLMATFLFLLPAFGMAADFRNAETVSKDESVKNLYLAGQNPSVEANVAGDLVTAGNTITVDGNVSGGVLAAGNVLNLNSTVTGSLRVAGGTVNLNGTVLGDVVIFGGNVFLGSKSIVNGDVIVFGGTLDMKGKVLGSVKNSYAGNVTLDGHVAGDVNFKQVGTLVVASGAVIGGNLKYSSQNEGTISSDAKIGGKTEFAKVATKNDISSLIPDLGSTLFGLLMTLVTVLLFIYLAPKFVKNVVNSVVVKPWAKLGIGFLTLIVTPLLLLALVFTFFGLGVMGYLLIAYVVLIALAATMSAIFAGSFTWKFVSKGQEMAVNWKTAIVGLLVVAILKFIPILGWFAAFLLFLLVFGTLVTMSFEFVKAQRA